MKMIKDFMYKLIYRVQRHPLTRIMALTISLITVYETVWVVVKEPGKYNFIAIPLTAVIAIQFGLFLYWMRCKYRFFYGVLELMAGSVTFSYVIYELSITVTDHNFFQSAVFGTYLKLAAGLYIVVRGYDNIDQGVHNKSSIRGLMDRMIHNKWDDDDPAACERELAERLEQQLAEARDQIKTLKSMP